MAAEGAQPLASLLIVPGWKDELEQYRRWAASLSRRGWQCLIVPIPQEARDQQTRRRHLRLLTAAANDFFGHREPVRAESGAPLRCVMGFSYGGFLAALLSSRLPIDALLLRSPAMYGDAGWDIPKDDLDQGEIGKLRVQSLKPSDSQALEAAYEFSGDVLVVECELDEIVPRETHVNYFSAFQAARSRRLHVIEGADHALRQTAHRDAFYALASDWLGALLPPQL